MVAGRKKRYRRRYSRGESSMKLTRKNSAARSPAGIMLIECLVYISVFFILTGLGMAAFYFCWDHTRATIAATNNIEAVQRAGEGWRADIRAATGKISVATTVSGETVTIPEGKKEIVYRFASGEVRRESSESSSPAHSRSLLQKVKASEMKIETRGDVTAWRWELALPPMRQSVIPLLFTFEAAAKNAS
jgi:hypothetical protein